MSSNTLFVPTESIELIVDPTSPIYDARVTREPDEYQLADFRERGQRTPIELVTRENLAEFGIYIKGDYTVLAGRGRVKACRAVGIPMMEAKVYQIDSLAAFLDGALRENTHRDEETLESMIQKARKLAELGASVEKMMGTFRKPQSTIASWLKLGDETGTVVAPEIREMIKAEEIDLGSANQLVSLPVEQQKEAVQEIAKLQAEAVQTGATKKGAPVVLKENSKGDIVAKPSQDTVQEVKAKVQKKAKPASVKPNAAGTVAVVDAAMVKAKLANVALMRRLPNADASYIAGYEAALKSLLGEKVEAPEGAAYAEMHRILFPVKAE